MGSTRTFWPFNSEISSISGGQWRRTAKQVLKESFVNENSMYCFQAYASHISENYSLYYYTSTKNKIPFFLTTVPGFNHFNHFLASYLWNEIHSSGMKWLSSKDHGETKRPECPQWPVPGVQWVNARGLKIQYILFRNECYYYLFSIH